MAKASWCNVSPMSGKRDGILTISAGAHTGRVARNTVVTVTAANGTKPSASIAVSQAGAGVSTTMDTSKPDLPSSGGVVNINGTSNSSKLKWTCTARVVEVDMPIDDNYVKVAVNGGNIGNNVAIPGDPGASGRFNFVATLTFPASMFPVDAVVTFRLTDDTDSAKQCTFTWKAGASSLSVNKSSLSLVNGGTGQTVNVTSNDDWNVS
jgi:hypothetical protein